MDVELLVVLVLVVLLELELLLVLEVLEVEVEPQTQDNTRSVGLLRSPGMPFVPVLAASCY